jgi:hypothetical protein
MFAGGAPAKKTPPLPFPNTCDCATGRQARKSILKTSTFTKAVTKSKSPASAPSGLGPARLQVPAVNIPAMM